MAKTKDKADLEPVPQSESQHDSQPVDIQNDDYRGFGGSYVFDPATGKRTRIGNVQNGGLTHESE